jgi:hypothetical protein
MKQPASDIVAIDCSLVRSSTNPRVFRDLKSLVPRQQVAAFPPECYDLVSHDLR